MKAIVRAAYGPAESLSLAEVPLPEVGDTDILIKMRASTVNPYDWHMVRGEPYLLRMSAGYRRPKNHAMGIDAAGIVTAVGEKVTRFQPGDQVFGIARGAFAEFAAADEKRLATKPDEVTFESAASLPCAGITALQAVRDKGQVALGMSVLVNGAAGGVGSFAVQIARSFGAKVTGVCSTRNIDLVRSLGATEVVDYTLEDFAQLPRRYDVVIDTVGNRSLGDLRRSLKPRGTLVLAGGAKGKWLRPIALLLKATVVSPFVREHLRVVMANVTPEDLESLCSLVKTGEVVPLIDRTNSLDDVPEALAYIEEGHARGKVVITV
ncbi:MAG: NAD(P)-dependent alcohol dehydrogenase [Acidimicrobiales bacterium]